MVLDYFVGDGFGFELILMVLIWFWVNCVSVNFIFITCKNIFSLHIEGQYQFCCFIMNTCSNFALIFFFFYHQPNIFFNSTETKHKAKLDEVEGAIMHHSNVFLQCVSEIVLPWYCLGIQMQNLSYLRGVSSGHISAWWWFRRGWARHELVYCLL